ncbi:hypothetical protein Tco_0449633 [Tanacetum coccineum]
MMNGSWTPWDMARFAAVKEYDNLRLKNEENGLGNSHLMDPMDFVRLMNDSKSIFDPYLYMEEMQEKLNPHAAGRARLTITDYVETDDDSQDGDLPVSVVSDDDSPRESFVAAQESSAAVSDVSAEPKSSQEGLQKMINNNLHCSDYADVVVSDDVKHKPCIIDLEKKNQEGDLPVAALRKNIDELLLAFELCFDPSSFENKKNQ